MESGESMENNDRFILVETYKGKSIHTIIGTFDEICEEIEFQLYQKQPKEDYFKIEQAIVYDRKYSDSGLDLKCYYNVSDSVLYSQFIDSYYGEEL